MTTPASIQHAADRIGLNPAIDGNTATWFRCYTGPDREVRIVTSWQPEHLATRITIDGQLDGEHEDIGPLVSGLSAAHNLLPQIIDALGATA